MRLGFSLPQAGPVAGPASIRAVSERAESVGYDSLWVFDRLLSPLHPKAAYPASADGKLPPGASRVLDSIGTLTYAAACTQRAKLGSSIINLPFYNPVLLARELTTLDILSGGRLRAGFGSGWSPDEYEAAGVDMKTRGARMNEAIDVIVKLWTEAEPEHKGPFFSVPKSRILRPVQQPRPPIYLAAYTPATMKRVAEKADGWNPAGVPVPAMKEMFAAIRGMAQAAGRDPRALELVVRANLHITPSAIAGNRPVFVGSLAQIREDIHATRDIGAHELFFDIQFGQAGSSLATLLASVEELWALAH